MSLFKLLTLVFLCGSLTGVSQITIQGHINSPAGEPIPYANVIIRGKKGGSYSNELGFFEIPAVVTDTVVFSSVGYQRKALLASQSTGVVVLNTDTTLLESITVRANNHKSRPSKLSFGYLNSKGRSSISSGVPGVQFATLIENTANIDGIIETIFIGISSHNKSRIRVRFYKRSASGVGPELSSQNFIFDISGKHKPYKFDVSSHYVLFPKEGFFVAVEFLGDLDKNGNIIQKTTSNASLFLTDGDDLQRNTWQNYRDGLFYPEQFSAHSNTTSNAMIGVSALFVSHD
ncbi:MAG: carboxypeptidase-like regulatory domain-containing protein [Cytophagales bacterium]|nr:carboxypeptidase-like regulatory domain-containing protein [Cytophagales bacterium]MCA6382328.1 carboxypeptidase-like regulatory domain-containing protein [Cytophagales bacterium]